MYILFYMIDTYTFRMKIWGKIISPPLEFEFFPKCPSESISQVLFNQSKGIFHSISIIFFIFGKPYLFIF